MATENQHVLCKGRRNKKVVDSIITTLIERNKTLYKLKTLTTISYRSLFKTKLNNQKGFLNVAKGPKQLAHTHYFKPKRLLGCWALTSPVLNFFSNP